MTQRDRTRGSSGFSRDVTAPAAGGRRPASPYENTRPVLRPNWLSPGASSRSRRKQTFLRLTRRSVFFFSAATLSRLAVERASRRVYLRPFARFVTRPRRRSIRRSFSGDPRVRASNASNVDERKEKGGGEDDPTRQRKLKQRSRGDAQGRKLGPASRRRTRVNRIAGFAVSGNARSTLNLP